MQNQSVQHIDCLMIQKHNSLQIIRSHNVQDFMEQHHTIEITFDDLAVTGDDSTRLPLSALNTNCHIHGELKIKIQDRYVPHLGFWGPNDVCFSYWIEEFENICKEFKDKVEASYTYDEGEQGQPAFLFEKQGDSIYLSIVDSQYEEGSADEEWQKIAFSYKEFVEQYESFYKNFIAELYKAAPKVADLWIKEFLPHK